MNKIKLTGKQLRAMGYPEGPVVSVAIQVMSTSYKHSTEEEIVTILTNVLDNPKAFLEDENLSRIATKLLPDTNVKEYISLYETGINYKIYGADHIEQGAIDQMNIASRIPVSVAGALMPDAHQGYGLPIGGVLATRNAIIPYAVGVDIGCRMCLSIFDIPSSDLIERKAFYQRELVDNTLFGSGQDFGFAADHEVIDRKEFNDIPFLKSLQMKAAKQLGSSGSGNHFVEWGIVEIIDKNNPFRMPIGKYVGLLSHSGSRGLGANIANRYTNLAMKQTVLPKEAQHLAWLDLDTEKGMEYWLAMNIAGDYASACHHTIHKKIAKAIGIQPHTMVENHHNFAWKEMYNGEELIVHRKGATPAGKDVLGIIPGSMTAPGFIVKGKGNISSINSASHGAGRLLSRTKAKASITNEIFRKELADFGVTLLGGGLDEAPQAYKNIHEVMANQTELVDILGKFSPIIVQMDKEDDRRNNRRRKNRNRSNERFVNKDDSIVDGE
jgi:tRNA-splicing ligase RtcB (3'-phosphate/5'-hydroxy nucleic acid ligase)